MTVYAAAAALKRELTEPTVGQTVILTRVANRATALEQFRDSHLYPPERERHVC